MERKFAKIYLETEGLVIPTLLNTLIRHNNTYTDYYYEKKNEVKNLRKKYQNMQQEVHRLADEDLEYYLSDDFKKALKEMQEYINIVNEKESEIDMTKDILKENFSCINWFAAGYNSVSPNKIKLSFCINNDCYYIFAK